MSNSFEQRRTFAIISHPDAGKTTLTEKLLWYGGAISMAGTVKARKSTRHATSDWMEMEKKRGISITTSVMQFPYKDCIINLLDTPGHADFSEDTYRTLTAVDSALMVIDAAKGVEERTIKLLEVCRMRNTPVMTFINKMDREGRPPLDLLQEIEKILNIECVPMTWPMGMGRDFSGIYHLEEQACYLYPERKSASKILAQRLEGLDHPDLAQLPDAVVQQLREEVELIQMASHPFDQELYHRGRQTPVFFGSAMTNFGVKELLDAFATYAPSPQPRATQERMVEPTESKFTGFVFKIQANMDPAHHDRVAFIRLCSGVFKKGIRLKHVQQNREIQVHNALTFMAGEREQLEEAYPGDIIGLHTHGGIHIGDSFTEGELLRFSGIPHFAPELFRTIRLKDPLKNKALQKGLKQLSEEGAVQVFKPIERSDLVVGAIGVLQFDVVAYRLKAEYNVDCLYEQAEWHGARWVSCNDPKKMTEFKQRLGSYLAWDMADRLTYLAPSRVHLNLTMERWPEVTFDTTRES